MSVDNKKKAVLLLGAALLFVLIYIAPRQASDTESPVLEDHTGHQHEEGENHEDTYTFQVDSVDLPMWNRLQEMASLASSDEELLAAQDSISAFAKKNNYPPLLAEASAKKAGIIGNAEAWMKAGDDYFKAFRLSKNQNQEALKEAVAAYEKVLQMEPDYLAAKTALGVAYVEGAAILGEMPMKGIGILKEVLNTDPENIDALTNLGYFAIQSGQYEKAIERFEQILSIDPKNAEAFIYLTDIYLSQNDIEKGISTLEQYKALVEDPMVKQQVDEYIKEIRNK